MVVGQLVPKVHVNQERRREHYHQRREDCVGIVQEPLGQVDDQPAARSDEDEGEGPEGALIVERLEYPSEEDRGNGVRDKAAHVCVGVDSPSEPACQDVHGQHQAGPHQNLKGVPLPVEPQEQALV